MLYHPMLQLVFWGPPCGEPRVRLCYRILQKNRSHRFFGLDKIRWCCVVVYSVFGEVTLGSRQKKLTSGWVSSLLDMDVSENSGFSPKSSILIGFSMNFTIHFGVFPYFWKHPYLISKRKGFCLFYLTCSPCFQVCIPHTKSVPKCM